MKKYIKTDNIHADKNTTHADKNTTHVYRYTLDGQSYFVELTDEDRDAFEDRYDVSLSYWRD